MKKILIFIATTAIILTLIFVAIRDSFNLNKIITELEKQNDLTITLNNESKWNYYPIIKFNNNITIKNNSDFFKIDNADIDIAKKYWPTSPINIDLISDLCKWFDQRSSSDFSALIYKGINDSNFVYVLKSQ